MTRCLILSPCRTWLAVPAIALVTVLLTVVTLAQPASPTGPATESVVSSLQGIVVVPRLEDVNQAGLTGIKGVVIKGPAFLQNSDFERMLAHNLGSPLTVAALFQMQTNIVKYCRAKGHLVVDVFYREQDVPEGTIQIAVLEGKVGKIAVENPDPKWFSDKIILRGIRLKPGDTVLEGPLNSDLTWLNRNSYQSLGYEGFRGPFRDVSATFVQGGLGETDVKLMVQDRFPVRPFVGVEDSGIPVIGEHRFFAGVNWANAFWQDHRLSYEYITDTEFDKLREHVTSYVVPLPWRHELALFGVYADLNPDFSVLSTNFATLKNSGTYYQISARYTVPLPSLRKFDHEITAGFDFKRTDTPLLFEASGPGSLQNTNAAGNLLKTNKIDVAQFVLTYSGRLKDHWGTTALSLQGVYSPGGLTAHNNESDFQDFATGTDPHYFYGRLEVRRETRLPYRFSWYTRAVGQISDSKLVATEVLSLGGYDTVRGYDERIVTGDQGWLLVNELRTPPIVLGNLTGLPRAVDWIQGLVFCDYGGAINRDPHHTEVLLSVGAGFRYQIAGNLRARFDYGFQLDRDYLNAPNAALLGKQSDQRAHFGLELSF